MTAISQHKAHNTATEAKLQLRALVLQHLSPAHVFDAFCGPVGEMWRGCWREATSYIGCDEEIVFPDPRRRFVGDSRIVMRAIDLARYNVFDFDAFGSPWEWMVLLAARRRWAPGERGAVVLTDGSAADARMANVSHALAELTGMRTGAFAPKTETADQLARMALQGWIARSRVRLLHHWEARRPTNPEKGGSVLMVYSTLIFEGL